jgi:hypothetical protein
MKKLMFILAMVSFVFAASCTPESLVGEEQQIDKKDVEIPNNG